MIDARDPEHLMNRGLEPYPDGTIIELYNPYTKTVRLELHTNYGAVPYTPPKTYRPPNGYRLEGY